MLTVLARNWWVLALRGLAAVLFGLMAFLWPGITLTALVLLFGAFALLDGTLAIVSAVTGSEAGARWWALLVEGIVGILAAVATAFWPDITALALVYLIAAWAMITGVMEVVAAIRLRQEIEGEWLLALSGIASVVFGLYAAIFPGAGALALVWVIGAYALVWGVVLIALAFRLRRHGATRRDKADRSTEATMR